MTDIQVNTVVQPEYDSMRPSGVTNHIARIHITNRRQDRDTVPAQRAAAQVPVLATRHEVPERLCHDREVPGYELIAGPPDLDSYLRLRAESGLSPKAAEQGAGALSGSWSWCHIRSEHEIVAMGRVIGDGGWYFHVADMATLPAHQGQGLGRRVLKWLLDDIRQRAPAGAYVNLVADPPGQPLYRKLGFTETLPSIAMAQKLSE